MKITEADFLKQVIDLAHLCKWEVAHFRTSMNQRGQYMTAVQGDAAGFPDLVLVRGNQLIFAELKSETGKLTEAQRGWREALQDAGQVCFIWRPSNWEDIVWNLK